MVNPCVTVRVPAIMVIVVKCHIAPRISAETAGYVLCQMVCQHAAAKELVITATDVRFQYAHRIIVEMAESAQYPMAGPYAIVRAPVTMAIVVSRPYALPIFARMEEFVQF